MPSRLAEPTSSSEEAITLGSCDDAVAEPISPPAWFARLLVVGGLIGLLAASVLLVEKIAMLEDPDYVPTCSINPIVSCGSVMTSPQAEAFGFPNPLIGVAGFAAVAAIGVACLAGAATRNWFWIGLQVGATFGVVFVHWLAFQSIYRIGAMCPYCLAVWAVTIPLFWYTTLWNLRRLRGRAPRLLRRISDGAWSFHAPLLTAWFLAIAAAITIRFWDYWSTLL